MEAAAAVGFVAGSLLCCLLFFMRRGIRRKYIDRLTEYLGQVNSGGGGIWPVAGEDDLSRLQDEIYKTVTELYRTREQALAARDNYAGNLSNIAHQIKTPITAASLSLQMMEQVLSEEKGGEISAENRALLAEHVGRIERQLSRLVRLEESLLLLSRIDAGTLALERKPVDVFTLLELSADHLRELSRESGVALEVEEAGEAVIEADLEWTMEAVMNLLKNCMEHTPEGGLVRCSYEQNPIYTEIRIWDTGEGFEREDLPRLFERFYRGKQAKKEGVGIGLSLAKEIIEWQNGVIGAENLPEGGACFRLRFYSH